MRKITTTDAFSSLRSSSTATKYLGSALIAGAALLTASDAFAVSITQVTSFGSNPGNVKMYKYVPASMPSNAPLVVVIHGCTQSAQAYADQGGWHKYADLWKFYLVFPEQQSGNNQNKCWNFFESSDYQRGFGEALSIKQMVDNMKANHSVDANRVYVTGLSSGGAFTNVMLATYPDVFAGGAPIAGIPYKCATSMTDAFSCMSPGVDKTPTQWGNLIRGAYSGYSGPWPKVSIWQGDQDHTVKAVNATETMEGWTDVNGIDQTPDLQDTVKGYPHKGWKNASGDLLVELYTITGMGHGTPLGVGSAEDQCGTAGAYMLDVGICSSYFIGKFWGLDNSDQEAPTVSISSPSNGAGVSGTVTISATASDNVGVDKVDFYIDGKLFKSDNSSPYSVSWDSSSAANGTHSILAKAYDTAGNVGTSTTISVTVSGGVEDTTAPTVSLTFPTNGATLGGTVTLAASANDDFGVTKVEFFVDDVSVGTGTPSEQAGPWTLSWNSSTVSDGSHAVKVKAYDAKGNVGTSSTATITVNQNIAALDETFSDRDGNSDYYDNTGWTSSTFSSSTENNTTGPAGSNSAYGYASSGVSCITGTKTQSLSKSVTLGDNPKLTYWRKLDLSATANTSYTAALKVYVGGTVVDSKSVTYGSYSEGWTQRADIDLSSWANQTVTVKFEASAYADVCMEAYAKVWIDDIKIANPEKASDTTAPTTSITNPSGTVSGTVDVTASASDNVGVTKVEFYIDGKLASVDTSSPYSYTWNTLDFADGDHTVQSKAYDAAGNVGSSSVVTVTVSNSGGGGGGGTTSSSTFSTIGSDDGYVKAYSDGSSSEVGAYESTYGLAIGRGSDSKYNRTILSFDTSSIPDTATVTKAYLKVTHNSAYGDPWASPSGNTLVIDVKTGCFGGGCGTGTDDWAASATASAVANLVKWSSGTQNSSDFSGAGLSAINKTGKTQLRLRFSQNQSSTNYIWIKTGGDAKLVVEYQ